MTGDDLERAVIDVILDRDVLARDELDVDGVRYMTRYYVVNRKDRSVRFHRLWTDDPGRALHDHPWDYRTLLLTGGYRETTVDGPVDYWAPAILDRKAEDLHRLELLAGPMLTLVSTGPVRRRWGFDGPDGWVHWSAYPDAGSRVDR